MNHFHIRTLRGDITIEHVRGKATANSFYGQLETLEKYVNVLTMQDHSLLLVAAENTLRHGKPVALGGEATHLIFPEGWKVMAYGGRYTVEIVAVKIPTRDHLREIQLMEVMGADPESSNSSTRV